MIIIISTSTIIIIIIIQIWLTVTDRSTGEAIGSGKAAFYANVLYVTNELYLNNCTKCIKYTNVLYPTKCTKVLSELICLIHKI